MSLSPFQVQLDFPTHRFVLVYPSLMSPRLASLMLVEKVDSNMTHDDAINQTKKFGQNQDAYAMHAWLQDLNNVTKLGPTHLTNGEVRPLTYVGALTRTTLVLFESQAHPGYVGMTIIETLDEINEVHDQAQIIAQADAGNMWLIPTLHRSEWPFARLLA
ncbi:hypothetical protein AB6D11_00640 [Vibrio splendidus]